MLESRRRLLRHITALAVLCTLWLLAAPARAAAPLCDTRGATTFAPAPNVDPTAASIDIGSADEDCERWTAETVRRGTPESSEAEAPSQLVPPDGLPRLAAGSNLRLVRASTLSRLAPGVRNAVERPPRTV